MANGDLNWIANYIWNIADDVLRDLYVRGKYRDVILRFLIDDDDPEYSFVTRSSDGQMLFLTNNLSKMKTCTRLGRRIAEVHNGSSLFTGDTGEGEGERSLGYPSINIRTPREIDYGD